MKEGRSRYTNIDTVDHRTQKIIREKYYVITIPSICVPDKRAAKYDTNIDIEK